MFLENTINKTQQTGWIEVICGSMFSGKTEELIRRLKRAEFAHLKVEIFKPAMDVRYEESLIISHDRNSFLGTPIDNPMEIPLLAADCDVVGIDEAQFFSDNIVEVCNLLANQGKRVIVAGLDMDYRGRPFGPMPFLMATAEYVTKLYAICVRTGNLANYTHRISSGEKLVELGEKDKYEPLSRYIFWQEIEREKREKENLKD